MEFYEGPGPDTDQEPKDLFAIALVAVAIAAIIFGIGYFVGQDHPKPGTTLTPEAAQKLERYDELEQMNTALKEDCEQAEKELRRRIDQEQQSQEDAISTEEVAAAQDFEVAIAEEGTEGTTEITPFGIPILVEASLNTDGSFITEHPYPKTSEPDVTVNVSFAGKKVQVPTNDTWTRVTDLLEVRYSTSDGSLGYEYQYDKEGNPLSYGVTTHMYRVLETRLHLKTFPQLEPVGPL